MKGKTTVKTDPQTQCSSCGASYSYVALGRREYFISWGSHCLCDKCHRFAIMEAYKVGVKRPFEPPKWYGHIHSIILGDLVATLKKCWPERVMKMRKWPRTESEDLGFCSNTAWRAITQQVKDAAHMQKQNYWLVYLKFQQGMVIVRKWMESSSADTRTKNCLRTKHT